MQRDYVPRMINLERSDYQVVRRTADQRGLGEKGFSAALQMIIREWQEFQLQDPAHMTAEDADRSRSHRSAAAALETTRYKVTGTCCAPPHISFHPCSLAPHLPRLPMGASVQPVAQLLRLSPQPDSSRRTRIDLILHE